MSARLRIAIAGADPARAGAGVAAEFGAPVRCDNTTD